MRQPNKRRKPIYTKEWIDAMRAKHEKNLERNEAFIKNIGHSDTVKELLEVLRNRPMVINRSEYGHYIYNAHITLQNCWTELRKQLAQEILNEFTIKMNLKRIKQTLDILRPEEVKLTRWQKIKARITKFFHKILSIKKSY